MRKRINRACIASSENYSSSKKAHKAMLKENHVNNNALFLIISTTPTPKTLSPLERFEKGLKRQLEEFKLISMKKLLIFALGMILFISCAEPRENYKGYIVANKISD